MQKCITNVQVVKKDLQQKLAKNSLTLDIQVVRELDEIARSTCNDTYSKSQIFEFLR